MPHLKIMLDSNAYDYIIDNRIDPVNVKKKGELFITNVQISELANTPNNSRRITLQNLVDKLRPEKLFLESGLWIDELRWDDDQKWIDHIGSIAQMLADPKRKNPDWRDALIGEVAKTHGLLVVTSDNTFLKKLSMTGIQVLSNNNFFSSDLA